MYWTKWQVQDNLIGMGRKPSFLNRQVMARKKASGSSTSLDKAADQVRLIFQEMLKSFVVDKEEKIKLARILGKTPSMINKMLYKGLGGLDIWVKALAHYHKLDEQSLLNFKNELRKSRPIQESDKIWFSIKEKGASEDDMLYLAQCAHEAFRIKGEIEELKKKR